MSGILDTGEYESAVKTMMNEVLPFSRWMDLNGILLSEIG